MNEEDFDLPQVGSEETLNLRRRVEVYPDASGQFRWRRIAVANGKVVADGAEAYSRAHDAREAAARENPGVPVVEVDEERSDA